MERAIAREHASSPDLDTFAASPESLPASTVTWQRRMQPRMSGYEARQLALGKRMPASRMGSLQPFRMPPRQGMARGRRPGALPTIPSVTSLGSVGTRSSFLSDAPYSQKAKDIERSMSFTLTHYIESVEETPHGGEDEGDAHGQITCTATSAAISADIGAAAYVASLVPLSGGRTVGSGGRLPQHGALAPGRWRSASAQALGLSPDADSSDGDFASIQEDVELELAADACMPRPRPEGDVPWLRPESEVPWLRRPHHVLARDPESSGEAVRCSGAQRQS